MAGNKNRNMKIPTYFILGYPRSGTTWFANLFNTHPDVAYRHEMIGRCYRSFPEALFTKLKNSYSLSDDDYQEAIKIVMTPNVESDRAPFFHKNHLTLDYPRLHYTLWLASKTVPLLRPAYGRMFYPKGNRLKLIIKETRSALNMDSITQALRSDKNIILFRHPCGAIASSLNGISSGRMQASTEADRLKWFEDNKDRKYLKDLELEKPQFLSIPEHEYLALRWRLQNEDYLNFFTPDKNIYIHYEDFMIDQEQKVKNLFSKLPLSYDPVVKQFILTSSGVKSSQPLLKDSSSKYYSVYRSADFNPNKWKDSLSSEQIDIIERHTLDTFNKLTESYIH